MKTQIHIILLCLAEFTFSTGCEKATLHNDQALQTTIKNRGDCNACPDINKCCCAVWLQDTDDEASLLICGSTSGTSTCYKSGCGSFTGISYSFTLFDDDVYEFCALISGPFWIKNTDGSDYASIVITCQNDETSPQTVQITLGPGDERYFANNGACEIGPCP